MVHIPVFTNMLPEGAVSIHPWVDGNGRMSRLIMNHLQFEFNLVPTKVIKNLKAEIELYEKSMDDDVVINVGKDLENVGKENCYDTYNRKRYCCSANQGNFET